MIALSSQKFQQPHPARRFLTALLLVLLLAGASRAPGAPFLVRDIYPYTSSPGYGSINALTVGDTVYFYSEDATHGAEIWKSDGTPAGTGMIKDINPGPNGSIDNRNPLVAANGIVYFQANDGVTGWELWRTNGTPEGTFLVKDFQPGALGGSIYAMSDMNGVLYVCTHDLLDSSYAIWKSDGTTGGTVKINNLFPADQQGSSFKPLASINGINLFVQYAGLRKNRIWRSNGSASGTTPIAEFYGYYFSMYCTKDRHTLYYFCNDSSDEYAYELWKTDGTQAGTTLIKNDGPDFGRSQPGWMAEMNGKLFFTISDNVHGCELWKSNGTTAGTTIVKDIWPGSQPYVDYAPGSPAVMNGAIYFTANDGVHGRELWKSDGTAAGTNMVKEIYPGVIHSNLFSDNESLHLLGKSGNTLYLLAFDSPNGPGLWKSDGTAQGTVSIRKFLSCSYFSDLNGMAFLFADDGINGMEPWKSNGTASGTVMIKDLLKQSIDSKPDQFTEAGGTLYFLATSPRGRELWKSNGTGAGTTPLFASNPLTYPEYIDQLTVFNGTLYFIITRNGPLQVDYNYELWKTRGDDATTTRVKTLYDTPFKPLHPEMAVSGSKLFYSTMNGFSPAELWVSDGMTSGAQSLKQFSSTGIFSFDQYWPHDLTDVNGTLYFVAGADTAGVELWKSNGTSAGTVLVKDINPHGDAGCKDLTASRNRLFFTTGDLYSHERKLWVSDGSATGTVMVKDTSYIQELADVNGTLFFSMFDPLGRSQLWKSNGTAAGTVLVKKDTSGTTFTAMRQLTHVNGRLFFTATESRHGEELWVSDGTEAGTKMVWDLNPGPAGSLPAELKSIGGKLYFSASDGVHGAELWVSDGTGMGTRLLGDITPGAASSNPASMTLAGKTLLFSATNSATNQGMELWGLKLGGSSGAQDWQAYR